MKAMVYTEFGTPDVLELQEVEKPTPKDDEVLVQVQAASINFGDASFLSGKPFLVRLMGAGLLKPQNTILGSDIAGRVEAVGVNVSQFQPGDEVYADISESGWGGYAEYVTAPQSVLALKPTNSTFEEAAAMPQAAVVALQGLRDKGQVQPGQKVLINGASGGIGTFAVQIAKSFRAEVTGVCSTRNLDLVRSLGADHVIDYTQEDFAQNGKRYDLILATAGFRSIFDYRRALSDNGTYVMIGGTMAQIFQAMLLGPWLSMGAGKKMTNLAAKPNAKDLAIVKALVEAGKVKPIIERCYPLDELAAAMRHYQTRHAQGKIVIIVRHEI